MTAAEIFAVMDKVTREAWPECLQFENDSYYGEGEVDHWQIPHFDEYCPPEIAELLFEASMVRWLWRRWPNPTEFYLSPLTSHLHGEATIRGYQCELLVSGGKTITVSGTTPLEALAAACVQLGADHAA